VVVGTYTEKEFIAAAVGPRSDGGWHVFCERKNCRWLLGAKNPFQKQEHSFDAAFLHSRKLRENEDLFPEFF